MMVRRRHLGFLCTKERKEELGIEELPPGGVVTEADLGDTDLGEAEEDRCPHMPDMQTPDRKLLEAPEW